MSSTSRGGKRSPADFYPTPSWPVRRLLERVDLPGGIWIEPAAGDGAIIRAVKEIRSDVTWLGFELRKKCAKKLLPLVHNADVTANWLKVQPMVRAKVIFGNPPFSKAMEFIEHSLRHADYVVLLLRLNFVGTDERNAFFKKQMPNVYVVPNRISFTKDGKADSIEYAWFVWGPTCERYIGTIEVLNTTPVEERVCTRRKSKSVASTRTSLINPRRRPSRRSATGVSARASSSKKRSKQSSRSSGRRKVSTSRKKNS